MLARTIRAELLKLRRRPAWWILLAVLATAVALLGYAANYSVVAGEVPPTLEIDPDEFLDGLLPASVIPTVLSQLAQLGGPIALILGALAVGSEYSWGTSKTLATQGPSRAVLGLGKFVAIAVALLVLVVVGP